VWAPVLDHLSGGLVGGVFVELRRFGVGCVVVDSERAVGTRAFVICRKTEALAYTAIEQLIPLAGVVFLPDGLMFGAVRPDYAVGSWWRGALLPVGPDAVIWWMEKHPTSVGVAVVLLLDVGAIRWPRASYCMLFPASATRSVPLCFVGVTPPVPPLYGNNVL